VVVWAAPAVVFGAAGGGERTLRDPAGGSASWRGGCGSAGSWAWGWCWAAREPGDGLPRAGWGGAAGGWGGGSGGGWGFGWCGERRGALWCADGSVAGWF